MAVFEGWDRMIDIKERRFSMGFGMMFEIG